VGHHQQVVPALLPEQLAEAGEHAVLEGSFRNLTRLAGWGSVLSGLVYGVLAFFVRGKSLAALSGRNPRIEGLET
jgi:hypothetical protein